MRRLLKGDRREQRAMRRLEQCPDWGSIRKAVERVKGEAWGRFVERHGDWGRDLAWYVARRQAGLSLKALGVQAGMSNYAAAAQAITRFMRRCKTDHAVDRALQQVLKCIKI